MKSIYVLIVSAFLTTITYSQSNQTQRVSSNTASLANFDALQTDHSVELSWTAINENNLSSHEIQKSANGSSFTSIGTLPAQNNGTPYKYSFIDATPVEGNNYYRLRTTDKSGNVIYSNILNVNNSFRRTDIAVLPNPVHGGVLNLQLSNINSGKYIISLYSNAGQKVFARSLDFTNGSTTESINLPNNIAHGLYFLHITDGVSYVNKQIMLQ